MNIHEYEAKNLLSRYGVLVPPSGVASNTKEVVEQIKELGLTEAVIKVQIHAGGRGKAGGVKFAKNPEEIVRIAEQLTGMKIVNNQTGPRGVTAQKVIFYAPVEIDKEYYLAATIDRSKGIPILMASPQGGMEIEEIAEKNPDLILKLPFNIDGRIRSYHLLELAKFMGWGGSLQKVGMELASNLAKCFRKSVV